MSDEVRCVIFVSQGDKNGKGYRVEQIPVSTSELTIGSEKESTFRIPAKEGTSEIPSCRIVFDPLKGLGKITAKSSQVFVKEKALWKPSSVETETQGDWEPVVAFKFLEDSTQFGVKVGSHEFYIKQTKLMDVYDVKKFLVVEKGKKEEKCREYTEQFFETEIREKVKEAMLQQVKGKTVAEQTPTQESVPVVDPAEELIYANWNSTFTLFSKRLTERCEEKVQHSISTFTKEMDDKLNAKELDVSLEFAKFANQGFDTVLPKMKEDKFLEEFVKNNWSQTNEKNIDFTEPNLRLDSVQKQFNELDKLGVTPLLGEMKRRRCSAGKLKKQRKEALNEIEMLRMELKHRKRKRTPNEQVCLEPGKRMRNNQ